MTMQIYRIDLYDNSGERVRQLENLNAYLTANDRQVIKTVEQIYNDTLFVLVYVATETEERQ